MRKNRNDSIKTELLPWAARAARTVVVCAFVAALASACHHDGNAQIDNGTLGLELDALSGNNQGARPSFVYTQPLTLQALDSTAKVPMPYVQVDFTLLTAGSDAVVLIPTAVSDSGGFVTTRVRAPSSYGANIEVEARIRGTTVTSIFQLNTSKLGTATRFVADTTHNNVEVAGVPFGFVIRVADDAGATVPNYDGSLSMVWTFQSASSWGGIAPTLPTSGYTCVFTAGVCTTPTTYVLTDSRVTSKMWVGDGPDGLQDEFGKEITVLPNVRDHLLVADKIGGPIAGAVPYGATGIFFNADQGLPTAPGGGITSFAAAVVDVAGNFLGDPDAVSWQVQNESPVLVPNWGVQNTLSLVGITGSMKPKVVGSGDLTVTYTGAMGAVTPGARKLYVDPGPDRTKWRLAAITEHVVDAKTCVETGSCPATEKAGKSFTVVLKAVDSQGNALSGSASNGYTDDFTGNFRVSLAFTGGTTGGQGALKNSTCSDSIGLSNSDLSFQQNNAAPAATPIANSVCSSAANRELGTITIPFVKGTQNTTIAPLMGVLQWATDIAANNLTTAGVSKIHLTAVLLPPDPMAPTDCGQGFPCLSNGTGAGPIAVPTGTPAAINLWDGPGGPAAGKHPLCERTRLEIALPGNPALGGQGSTPLFNCPYLSRATSSDTPPDFYPVVEDRGGNWLEDLPSTFVGQLTTATEWTTLGGGTSGRFLPIVAAQDTVIVTANSTVNLVQDDGTPSNNVTLATTFGDTVAPLALDHFILQATDSNLPPLPSNTVSVLRPYTLKVLAYDINNNFLNTMVGNWDFTFTTVGSANSPKGTIAIPAPNGTYSFVAGTARIKAGVTDISLLQPKNQNITIQMSGVPSGGGAAILAQDLAVSVQPGAITSIEIRDAANGAGNNLTNQPVTMTDLDSMTFFATAFDDELNSLNPGSTNWTATGTLASLTVPAVIPATAASITYAPTLLGSGVLTASANGFSVSTGTVTVNASPATHLALSNATTPTAGGVASVSVQVQDARNNAINYTGNLTLDIQVSNTATRKGFSFTSAYAPQAGGPQAYSFTNGAIDTTQDFTLYNSGSPALIRYQVTAGPANIVALPAATLSVTPTPDAAYQVWTTKPGSTMAAGSTASYLAYMVDQYGNTVTGYPSSAMQVTLNAPSGDQKITKLNSIVTNAQTVAGTLNGGTASFDVTGTLTGTLDPRVTVTGGPANAAHNDSINVINAAPSQLVYTTNTNASYKAGDGLGVTLTIKDTYNNVITTGSDATALVTLNLYQSGVSAAGKQVGSWSMAAVAGVAAFNAGTVLSRPYITLPGAAFTVRAAAATAPGTSVGDSNTFTVTAADDYQLVYSTQPAAGTCTANGLTQAGQCAGAVFTTQPVVVIKDQYGNQSSSSVTNVFLTPYTSSNCAAGTVGNTGLMMPGSNPSSTSSSGSATFAGIGYKVADSTSGGSVYLQASAGALISACSNGVLVKPAQASAPTNISTPFTTGTVGSTHNAAGEMPQFKIVDAYGNGVPNYTINFSWYYSPGGGYNYGQTVTASATTNTSGIAQPSTFTLMNATGIPGTANSCGDGYNYIQADTSPSIGTAYSAQIFTTPSAPTSIAFTQNPRTGGGDQGQTLGTAVQTQGKAQLKDTYGNCAYNVANGSDTFTLSLYTDNTCTTPAAGYTLASNTATNSTGVATYSNWNATTIASTGTSYYVKATDSLYGYSTACGTHALKWYNPIGSIYFNTVGTTTITAPATTGSVLLIVKDGVPSSYSWSITSAGSYSNNCGNPSVSGSFTGGACPAGYTCSTYTPACLGNNSTDTVRVDDGSGTGSSNNYKQANITVSGAYLQWTVSTPTSWGAFNAATTTTYTLKNVGNGATGTDLSSAFSADSHFSIQSDNCSGVALAANTTCTLVIKFDPTATPALTSGANRSGSVYYYGAPGGQTGTINFNASRQ